MDCASEWRKLRGVLQHTGVMMSKSAAAFRRSEELKLPSGLVVEVRKPDITRLVMESPDGNVPSFVVGQVIAQLSGKGGGTEEWQPTADDLPVLSRFMDMVVKAALVWPVIVVGEPDYEAGQINIQDLDEQDRAVLFGWGLPGQAAAVARFREERAGSVESVSDV